jgi:DNA-binding transcriptional LysR family regulator
MELRQLQTFRTLAATCSFTRTAVLLSYAQSSITAQIQTLEEELGARLVDRLGKRVVLTDAGVRFLQYAEQILDLSDEARVALVDAAEPSGTLTISASESLCTYRLPQLLLRFRERYPAVRLIFRPVTFTDIQRSVGNGTLDAAFELNDPLQSTTLHIETLSREPLAVIAPSCHPLAQRDHVGPADMEHEHMLLTEAGCSYRLHFERALAAAGVQPATVMEFNSVEAIKQCVIAGMGLAVLPVMTLQHELEHGSLVALRWSESEYHIYMHMMWHRDKWISPALNAFLAMAREVLGTPAER